MLIQINTHIVVMVLDFILVDNIFLPDGCIGKTYYFWSYMSSYVHIDNEGKYILILGKRPTQGLIHMLTAETKYSVNFTRPGIKFCLSVHYNGRNSFLFVNTTKIYQFKAKDFEMKKYPLCLENISWKNNNMKKKKKKQD